MEIKFDLWIKKKHYKNENLSHITMSEEEIIDLVTKKVYEDIGLDHDEYVSVTIDHIKI